MFRIFVDSAANLPAAIVSKYNIQVLSLIYHVNGKVGQGFEPGLSPEEERAKGHEYYEAIRQGAVVKTALVNQGEFIDAFRPVLEAGEDVMYFSLSKNISGTYNAAKLAAEDLEEEFPSRRVYLVDSLNASLAQGMLAIYATKMREKGLEAAEITRILQDTVHKMNGVFTVGDLKYLARTGRLSNTAALVGNVLNIKPLLKGNTEGFIVSFQKCRGRKKALNELIELVCNNIAEPDKQIFGIAHADAYEDSLYVVDAIKARTGVKEVINTSYDFVTGSHVGPDTIALFFIANDRELTGRPADYKRPEIFDYI